MYSTFSGKTHAVSKKVTDKFGSYKNNSYFCSRQKTFDAMSTETMTQLIADYFKTQPVLKVWLFGSYSRGEQNADSDVDILIVPDKMVGLFKLSGMMLDLQDLLQKRVDLVTEKGLLPFARESVNRDKILIYERAA
jgi:predicted nucleotidyltransferase